MTRIGALWGSTLDGVNFDIAKHSLVLSIRIPSSAGDERHRLDCEGVTAVEFASSIPSPWSYVEVTEVHLKRRTKKSLRLHMMLWSEDAGLDIDAEKVKLDGQVLEGDAVEAR